MVVILKTGDVVRLKKKHPCGNDEWLIDKLGTDVGMTCTKCRHHVLINRSTLERRIKA
jgi:hypothetical protein